MLDHGSCAVDAGGSLQSFEAGAAVDLAQPVAVVAQQHVHSAEAEAALATGRHYHPPQPVADRHSHCAAARVVVGQEGRAADSHARRHHCSPTTRQRMSRPLVEWRNSCTIIGLLLSTRSSSALSSARLSSFHTASPRLPLASFTISG